MEADNSNILALLLEKLIRDYPNVQFHIHSGTSDDITERLERGLLDLAILLDPVDTDKYETILLPRKEKWGLLISENAIFAKKRRDNKRRLCECTSFDLKASRNTANVC